MYLVLQQGDPELQEIVVVLCRTTANSLSKGFFPTVVFQGREIDILSLAPLKNVDREMTLILTRSPLIPAPVSETRLTRPTKCRSFQGNKCRSFVELH